jgi:DNA replication and repair protein RecF
VLPKGVLGQILRLGACPGRLNVQVNNLTIKNFRNYKSATLEFSPRRNILIGENAQGKTNLLEAIELISMGRSDRAGSDREMISLGEVETLIELTFEAKYMQGMTETVALIISQGERLSRRVRVNGLSQPAKARSTGRFLSRLVTVSFKAQDLSLLRGGPKFRRDWLDELTLKLKPSHNDLLTKYEKVVMQRNRLLKNFFEKGRLTVSDQDELKVWDKQLAYYGALVIKSRVDALEKAIPEAENYHASISGLREKLGCNYLFRQKEVEAALFSDADLQTGSIADSRVASEEDGDISIEAASGGESVNSSYSTNSIDRPAKFTDPAEGVCASGLAADKSLGTGEIFAMETKELALIIMKNLRQRRSEEIARRQTLTGPHRDDVSFVLNGLPATAYASQGQQRSLVLALKLAELKLVSQVLEEPPLLLLDDVLAELDLLRQGMLMQMVSEDMQTLITTTHLQGFRPEWLSGAQIVEVANGMLKPPVISQI